LPSKASHRLNQVLINPDHYHAFQSPQPKPLKYLYNLLYTFHSIKTSQSLFSSFVPFLPVHIRVLGRESNTFALYLLSIIA